MRYLIFLTLIPLLSAGPVSLYFPDVETYYGGSHRLDDFYANDSLGGDYGIHSSGGYTEPFVIGGALHFPLHGPGVLYVEPGFHNFLTFQYTGYMPFAPYASLLLRYQGKVVQQILLPTTPINTYLTQTITIEGVADEIWFGVLPNGQFAGNAGDILYREIDVDTVDTQVTAAPQVTDRRAAPTVRSQAPTLRPQSAQARSPRQSVR